MNSKQKGTEERRKQLRFNFNFKVYDLDGKLLGITKNISSDGFFLETQKIIKKETLSISIELPGDLGTVNMDCEVKWSKKKGIGTKLYLCEDNIKNFCRIIDNLNILVK